VSEQGERERERERETERQRERERERTGMPEQVICALVHVQMRQKARCSENPEFTDQSLREKNTDVRLLL
jgi:hypothetical protein